MYSGLSDGSFPRVKDTPGTLLHVQKQGLQCWPRELPSGLCLLMGKASSALGWHSDSGSQTGAFEEHNEVVKRIFAVSLPAAIQR